MQTSGSSSSTSGTVRAAGLAGAIGLAILISGTWSSGCTPGEPNCSELGTLCTAGAGGGGGGAGGMGGGGAAAAPDECGALGVTKLTDFETKFIVPKCGQAKCHGPMSVFPPRNLDMPGMIRPNLIGKHPGLNCKEDFYINTTDFTKSFILQKVQAEGDNLPCPGAPTGKADAGGTRMPNKDDMPTVVGTRLSDGELACFSWWVESLSKL